LEPILARPVDGIIVVRRSRWQTTRARAASRTGIRDFACEFDISLGQVRDLIKHHGHDRETLEREAGKLNK
jgi:hypothetical protein